MKALSLASCLLASASGLDFGGSDTTETLLLWQVLKSGGDMGTQQTMLPLLMSNLFGKPTKSQQTLINFR